MAGLRACMCECSVRAHLRCLAQVHVRLWARVRARGLSHTLGTYTDVEGDGVGLMLPAGLHACKQKCGLEECGGKGAESWAADKLMHE